MQINELGIAIPSVVTALLVTRLCCASRSGRDTWGKHRVSTEPTYVPYVYLMEIATCILYASASTQVLASVWFCFE